MFTFRFAIIFFTLGVAAISKLNAQSVPVSEGKYIEYYPSGTVKERGFYRHSGKHKIWYYYNANGSIDKREKWKEGQLIWQIFYSKGRIIKTIDQNGQIKTRPNCGC